MLPHPYWLSCHNTALAYLPVSTSIGKGYAAAGQAEEAVRVLDRMRAANVQPDRETFNGAIEAVHAVGDMERADRLYEDAIATKAIDPYAFAAERGSFGVTLFGKALPKGTAVSLKALACAHC